MPYGAMDYTEVGFRMDDPSDDGDWTDEEYLMAEVYGDGQPVPPPKIEPLPPVQTGFTRTPREGDIFLCPNCDGELATDMGTENAELGNLKKQVWVAKHCGHTYCGECASKQNRTTGGIGAKAKGKGKAKLCAESIEEHTGGRVVKPLLKCVAKDCPNPKSVKGPTTMFQVYL